MLSTIHSTSIVITMDGIRNIDTVKKKMNKKHSTKPQSNFAHSPSPRGQTQDLSNTQFNIYSGHGPFPNAEFFSESIDSRTFYCRPKRLRRRRRDAYIIVPTRRRVYVYNIKFGMHNWLLFNMQARGANASKIPYSPERIGSPQKLYHWILFVSGWYLWIVIFAKVA